MTFLSFLEQVEENVGYGCLGIELSLWGAALRGIGYLIMDRSGQAVQCTSLLCIYIALFSTFMLALHGACTFCMRGLPYIPLGGQ